MRRGETTKQKVGRLFSVLYKLVQFKVEMFGKNSIVAMNFVRHDIHKIKHLFTVELCNIDH